MIGVGKMLFFLVCLMFKFRRHHFLKKKKKKKNLEGISTHQQLNVNVKQGSYLEDCYYSKNKTKTKWVICVSRLASNCYGVILFFWGVCFISNKLEWLRCIRMFIVIIVDIFETWSSCMCCLLLDIEDGIKLWYSLLVHWIGPGNG